MAVQRLWVVGLSSDSLAERPVVSSLLSNCGLRSLFPRVLCLPAMRRMHLVILSGADQKQSDMMVPSRPARSLQYIALRHCRSCRCAVVLWLIPNVTDLCSEDQKALSTAVSFHSHRMHCFFLAKVVGAFSHAIAEAGKKDTAIGVSRLKRKKRL